MKQKNGYVKMGVTVFCTVCAILLFYDTLFASRLLLRFGKKLGNVLAPLLYGALLAYLLAPVVNYFERKLFARRLEKARSK